ncbi:MAG: 1-acyl-sn-glycerol-3-phosphate acyltransferase [Brumimicrobium sp.]|nr:1-acyl-sn-glycerol-3-phosphate acyltransferase [Brumimicrobium sp.]MCO5267514.1 1-acyl-sn-glycerol-3-phosphate acyltransferase [Brumimicrobium sp.]
MRIFFGILLTPIYYLLIGLSLLVFHPIQWICLKLFGYKAHKASVDALNFCLTYSTVALFNFPVVKNNFEIPKNKPVIFVSNHQSLFDIPGLIYFFRKYHGKFISKIELLKAKIPSISFNLRHGGGANIDRKDPEQSKNEIHRFAERMKERNWSAFIFPEGTRTKTGKMKEFKVGGIASIISVIPDITIVPICINGSFKMISKGQFPLIPFHKLSWEVLQPVSAEGRDIEELIQEVENAIRLKLRD